MKIYESKKNYLRIVKAVFSDRTEFVVERKDKGKSTFGEFMLFPSLFRLFNKDPYEWLPNTTTDTFEKAEKEVEWLIDWDNKDYEKEHPIQVSVL